MTSRYGVALLHLRGDDLLVTTASGVVGGYELDDGSWQGLFDIDPDRTPMRIRLSQGDAVVGDWVRTGMLATKFHIPVPVAWAKGIDSDKPEQNLRLARQFGLPDARRLFTGMRYCCASLERGEISIMPTKRRPRGEFEPFDDVWKAGHEDVVLPAEASDAELGAAVRLGFERCL